MAAAEYPAARKSAALEPDKFERTLGADDSRPAQGLEQDFARNITSDKEKAPGLQWGKVPASVGDESFRCEALSSHQE